MMRTMQPLTMDVVRTLAPSAFTETAHASRSARYAQIPTVSVIEGMVAAGFFPFQASESRTKDETRFGFTKHMIRFRSMASFRAGLEVGGNVPEVVLINSHDGSSRYKLMAGIFRLICSNGMIVADSMLASISIRHTGDIVREVISGSRQLTDGVPRMLGVVRDWQAIELTPDEQGVFASAAHTLRFDAEGHVNTPIHPRQLLAPRRAEDATGNDLWRTFNRIQENVIKGGLHAVKRTETGRRIRRVSTREITGINQDVKLNRALWTLAEKMAELKQAEVGGPTA